MKTIKAIPLSEFKKVIKFINNELRVHGFKIKTKMLKNKSLVGISFNQICIDCGLDIDDPNCCQNDSELWK